MSDTLFKSASEHYLSNSGKSFSYENKARLYGLYKQVTMGDVQGKQPINLFNSWKGDRWAAWASCKGMKREDAQREYCDIIIKCDPSFKPSNKKASSSKASEAAAAAAATKDAIAAASQALPKPHFEVTEEVFNAAVDTASELKSDLDAVTKLGFYGLFKQAKFGDNNTPRPGMLDPVGGAKWDAWYSRRGQSRQEVQDQYVALLLNYDRNWLPPQHVSLKKSKSNDDNNQIDQDNQDDGTKIELTSKNAKKKKKNKSTGSLKNLLDETSNNQQQQISAPKDNSSSSSNDLPSLVRTNSFNHQLSAVTTSEIDSMASKKGYLHKMQERGLNILLWTGSDRWAERYFVLSGGTLYYYLTEEDSTPRGSFLLHRCTVKKEGVKTLKGGKEYHILALYLHGTEDASRGPSSGALLRVSSESEQLINEWYTAIAPRTKTNLLLPEKVPATSLSSGDGSKVSVDGQTSDQKAKAKSSRDIPASKPMHRKSQLSYLSAAESKKQNYRGLFNLAALILFVSNLRMFLKNFLVYGLLLNFGVPSTLSIKSLTSTKLSDHPILLCYLLNQVCLVTAYAIELSAVKRGGARGRHGFFKIFKNWNADTVVNFSHGVNILTVITIPTVVVWQYTSPPNSNNEGTEEYMTTKAVESFILLMTTVVMFMKLISYAHVHNDYRQAAKEAAAVPMDQVAGVIAKYTNTVEDTETLVRYPYNVTLRDIYYFWLAPTLTYQINFPRSKERRLWMIFSLLVRMFATMSLMIFLGQQHIMPSIIEATESIDRLQPWHIIERLLSIGIPVTYMWLLMFYLIFHLFLNFIAEILRFGDRVFYKDWWNSNTFEEYWRLWNIPVHFWLVRHLYFPCQRAGLSRGVCVFLVFFFSAALHELVVSVPFHLPRVYAFAAMLGQIPLVALTKELEKNPLWQSMNGGNFLFWAMFCIVGQPMALLLYYYDSHVLYQEGAGSVAGVAKEIFTSSLYSQPSPSSEL